MVKILSFDVGIKNLAYCYLECNEQKLDGISEWGVINLRSDLWMPDQNAKKCGAETKSGICEKGTNFWIVKQGKRVEMCKTHARNYAQQWAVGIKEECNGYNQCPEKLGFEYFPYELRELRCPCGEKSRKFFCKNIVPESAGEIVDRNDLVNLKLAGFCNKCSKTYVKNGGLEKLVKVSEYQKEDDTKLYTNLYNGLNALKTEDVEQVIIENQPALKNPRMKSIQMFLYTYYFVGGKEGKFSQLEKVGFFNATKKLNPTAIVQDLLKETDSEQLMEQAQPQEQEGGEKMSEYRAYKKRKMDGVAIVTKALEGMDNWKQYFASHPKKDDLADSLLQGIAQYSRN